MRQKRNQVLETYKEIDMIWGIIKYNRNVSEDSLLIEFQNELSEYHITGDQLKVLLEKLKSDLHAIESDSGKLLVHPISKTFQGYAFEEMLKKNKEKKKTAKEEFFRRFPILLTIIFGASTAFFSYQNFKISDENAIINERNNQKDIQIKQLTDRLDTMRIINVSK